MQPPFYVHSGMEKTKLLLLAYVLCLIHKRKKLCNIKIVQYYIGIINL